MSNSLYEHSVIEFGECIYTGDVTATQVAYDSVRNKEVYHISYQSRERIGWRRVWAYVTKITDTRVCMKIIRTLDALDGRKPTYVDGSVYHTKRKTTHRLRKNILSFTYHALPINYQSLETERIEALRVETQKTEQFTKEFVPETEDSFFEAVGMDTVPF